LTQKGILESTYVVHPSNGNMVTNWLGAQSRGLG